MSESKKNGYEKGDTLWFYNKDSNRQDWLFEAIRGDTIEGDDKNETTWDVNVYKDSEKFLTLVVVSNTHLPINLSSILKEFSSHMNGIIISCAKYGKNVNEASADVQEAIENRKRSL